MSLARPGGRCSAEAPQLGQADQSSTPPADPPALPALPRMALLATRGFSEQAQCASRSAGVPPTQWLALALAAA
eukprot:11365336-Alexandrium_andersonii.AAC.1